MALYVWIAGRGDRRGWGQGAHTSEIMHRFPHKTIDNVYKPIVLAFWLLPTEQVICQLRFYQYFLLLS